MKKAFLFTYVHNLEGFGQKVGYLHDFLLLIGVVASIEIGRLEVAHDWGRRVRVLVEFAIEALFALAEVTITRIVFIYRDFGHAADTTFGAALLTKGGHIARNELIKVLALLRAFVSTRPGHVVHQTGSLPLVCHHIAC
jgi:hypothetical protein